jgi:hypothetical protein
MKRPRTDSGWIEESSFHRARPIGKSVVGDSGADSGWNTNTVVSSLDRARLIIKSSVDEDANVSKYPNLKGTTDSRDLKLEGLLQRLVEENASLRTDVARLGCKLDKLADSVEALVGDSAALPNRVIEAITSYSGPVEPEPEPSGESAKAAADNAPSLSPVLLLPPELRRSDENFVSRKEPLTLEELSSASVGSNATGAYHSHGSPELDVCSGGDMENEKLEETFPAALPSSPILDTAVANDAPPACPSVEAAQPQTVEGHTSDEVSQAAASSRPYLLTITATDGSTVLEIDVDSMRTRKTRSAFLRTARNRHFFKLKLLTFHHHPLFMRWLREELEFCAANGSDSPEKHKEYIQELLVTLDVSMIIEHLYATML